MSHQPLSLSVETLKPVLLSPAHCALSRADTEVDGDRWGMLAIAEVQARLEAADDFAVLMLDHEFESSGLLEDLLVAVPAAGLRNLALDGTYMIPTKDPPEGIALYRMPTPLAPGVHKLQWSLVWSPPVDRLTGEANHGGVSLRPAEVCGNCACEAGVITAVPDHVAGRSLATLFPAAELQLRLAVNLPAFPVLLHVEGPAAGGLAVRMGGQVLALPPSAPQRVAVPIELAGPVELELTLAPHAGNITALRLDPA